MGRLFGLSSFAAFTGASLGTGFQVRAGIQAVNSLENPDRFKKALVEMSQEVIAQRQAALRRSPGSQSSAPVPQDGEHTKLADGWDTGSVRQPPSTPSPAPLMPEPGAGGDRWSQLRTQKSTAQPTTWDTIRQSHERVPSSMDKQDNQRDGESDTDRKRREAQAEFDALLARERGVGQDSTPELKARWS